MNESTPNLSSNGFSQEFLSTFIYIFDASGLTLTDENSKIAFEEITSDLDFGGFAIHMELTSPSDPINPGMIVLSGYSNENQSYDFNDVHIMSYNYYLGCHESCSSCSENGELTKCTACKEENFEIRDGQNEGECVEKIVEPSSSSGEEEGEEGGEEPISSSKIIFFNLISLWWSSN